jgi:hypothetical protein
MISDGSILRRLPASLDRKQVLFLDGIRHAVEIIDFANRRLTLQLTNVVLKNQPGPVTRDLFSGAFLDAWALVDATDRFRCLWQQFPGMHHAPPPEGSPTLSEATQEIRNIRNVADHIAQRMDFVLAHNGTALGSLTWCTLDPQDPAGVYTCALIPGTLGAVHTVLVNPTDLPFLNAQSGNIHLAAGGHRANLSAALPEIALRIRQLEENLESAFEEAGLKGNQAGSDQYIALRATSGHLEKSKCCLALSRPGV